MTAEVLRQLGVTRATEITVRRSIDRRGVTLEKTRENRGTMWRAGVGDEHTGREIGVTEAQAMALLCEGAVEMK
jgi:hypothetical protein